MITLPAKGKELDKIVGFEAAADDYLVKPYSLEELMLLFSPAGRSGWRRGAFHRQRMQAAAYVAEAAGAFTEPGCAAARRMGGNRDSGGSTLDTHISRVRCKLGEVWEMIKTLRGFGYKLETR